MWLGPHAHGSTCESTLARMPLPACRRTGHPCDQLHTRFHRATAINRISLQGAIPLAEGGNPYEECISIAGIVAAGVNVGLFPISHDRSPHSRRMCRVRGSRKEEDGGLPRRDYTDEFARSTMTAPGLLRVSTKKACHCNLVMCGRGNRRVSVPVCCALALAYMTQPTAHTAISAMRGVRGFSAPPAKCR
jgi:hypothetical protein